MSEVLADFRPVLTKREGLPHNLQSSHFLLWMSNRDHD